MNAYMVSVAEAKQLIGEYSIPMKIKHLSLLAARGRILAEDVFAGISIPGFRQSAMDGYAINFEGFQQFGALDLVGEVAAGAAEALPRPAPHQAVRIFTGAPVPDSFDTVVMQEKVKIEHHKLQILDDQLILGRNVRNIGNEIAQGDLALSKGTALSAAAIGFLSSLGVTHVLVNESPKIGVVLTGNELQFPGQPLAFGQVYESNSLMLQAALLDLGFEIQDIVLYRANDDLIELTGVLENALAVNDLVILTGGVSVGDYDFVVQAAQNCGVNQVFHKIKQKPGKPIFFGNKKSQLVFGLPGNPASVLTCFYEYVLDALSGLTGKQYSLISQIAKFKGQYKKHAGLTHFLKGIFENGTVVPLGAQESFRLSSFSIANCLILVEQDCCELAAGDSVVVHLFK